MQHERGNFLNQEQKEVKQNVMEKLLESFNLIIDSGKFNDAQSLMDMITSILVMFNREVLFNTLTAFSINKGSSEFMDNLFAAIKSEVKNRIDITEH